MNAGVSRKFPVELSFFLVHGYSSFTSYRTMPRPSSRFTGAPSISLRLYSNGSPQASLYRALENVNALLETSDKSSYILAQYIPEPARNAFLAIRAFNLEVNKIGNAKMRGAESPLGLSSSDLKFKFWSGQISKVFSDSRPETGAGEPITVLLGDALSRGLSLDSTYFTQFLQTRKSFIAQPQFSSISDICSYGEGTYSQLNYATQALLLSPGISPSVIRLLENDQELQSSVSDLAAHLGQAAAVGLMILGCRYYATLRNVVTMPVDIMAKHDLSQESVLQLLQGRLDEGTSEEANVREKLKEVVFETATTANDHILTARKLLAELKLKIPQVVAANGNDTLLAKQARKWRKNVPDSIMVPLLTATPTTLYLKKLEVCDFDILHPKLGQREWRLAWTSFVNYYQRRI